VGIGGIAVTYALEVTGGIKCVTGKTVITGGTAGVAALNIANVSHTSGYFAGDISYDISNAIFRACVTNGVSDTLVTAVAVSTISGLKTFSAAGGLVLATNFTGTTAGGIGQDTTQKNLACYTNGMKGWLRRTIMSMYANVSIGSTTTPTSALTGTKIGTQVLAANSWVAGKNYEINLYGSLVVSNSANVTMDVKYGSTVIGTLTTPTGTISSAYFTARIRISARAADGVHVKSIFHVENGTGVLAILHTTSNTTGSGVPTTSQALDVLFTHSVNNAGNVITINAATIEEF